MDVDLILVKVLNPFLEDRYEGVVCDRESEPDCAFVRMGEQTAELASVGVI